MIRDYGDNANASHPTYSSPAKQQKHLKQSQIRCQSEMGQFPGNYINDTITFKTKDKGGQTARSGFNKNSPGKVIRNQQIQMNR